MVWRGAARRGQARDGMGIRSETRQAGNGKAWASESDSAGMAALGLEGQGASRRGMGSIIESWQAWRGRAGHGLERPVRAWVA